MAKIAIDELERYLWGSAELLRTSIDAGAYKQYIFPLLFLKRLSDVYDEENAHAEAEYGAEARDWDETHLFHIPQGARWSDVRNATKNIGTALTNAFQAIEQANPEKLAGIFGDAAWTNKDRLPKDIIKRNRLNFLHNKSRKFAAFIVQEIILFLAVIPHIAHDARERIDRYLSAKLLLTVENRNRLKTRADTSPWP